jgi:hypothetical protein
LCARLCSCSKTETPFALRGNMAIACELGGNVAQR